MFIIISISCKRCQCVSGTPSRRPLKKLNKYVKIVVKDKMEIITIQRVLHSGRNIIIMGIISDIVKTK